MIAEVALNLPLRRVFDYVVAAELEPRIAPGCRVIVPVGRRLSSGIVVGLKKDSALPPQRLRSIQETAEGEVLFSQELLAFTRWVARYYFCGWGEVLESALPSGMGVRISVSHRLREDTRPEALDALSPQARKVVLGTAAEEATRAAEPQWPYLRWTASEWRRAGPTEEDSRWLARQRAPEGSVETLFEYAGRRARPVIEKWVRPAGALPPPERHRRNPLRETRREKVLRVLREEGPVPMGRLKAFMSGPGEVVKALGAEGLVELEERETGSRFRQEVEPEPFLPLNGRQQEALAEIQAGLQAREYRGFLLEGVTGSGKTEVYLHAVRETLAQGRSCLLLVPEIALTDSMVRRFRSRFGNQVAVLHSGMGEGERFDEWRRVHSGEAPIVIGARSAVFAPLRSLGLVVVDEEHDSSYKQDETPRYHGRDAAMVRAHQSGAVVVLGSATPSMEAMLNVRRGKLRRLELPARIEDRPLPVVEILDLKVRPRQKGSPLFTVSLVEALRETLQKKEQALLFINRRGFANLVRCRECEAVMVCDHCSISLTFHQAAGRLRCHRCDFSRVFSKVCPDCGVEGLEVLGLGTERIEQEVGIMFPDARVLRMDGDSLRRRGELERMFEGIRRRDYDVIIGTQVLSKGHDFPYITLVGAVLADVSLNLPDFRAAERTFQLLTQMAGRAGRGDLPGRVLVQTYSPEHYSLTRVRNHDTAGFAEDEMRIRESAASAPFRSQTLFWVTGPRAERVERLANDLAARLRRRATAEVEILGAAEGPIKKINNRFRWMVLLRADTMEPIHRLLRVVLDEPGMALGRHERIAVDVDPYNVM